MKGFSIKFKIIATTLLCVAVISFGSNLFLFNYSNNILEERAARINNMYLTTLQAQLDEYLSDIVDMVVFCANDDKVTAALSRTDNFTSAGMRAALSAQERLNVYLNVCSAGVYTDKLLAFNANGLTVEGITREYGLVQDSVRIAELPLYSRAVADGARAPYYMGITDSITPFNGRVLALLCPVRGVGSLPENAYVYAEIGLDLFVEILSPYMRVNNIFLAWGSEFITAVPSALPACDPATLQSGENQIEQQLYDVSRAPLSAGEFILYSCAPQARFGDESTQLLLVVIIILITSLFLAALLAVIISNYLTKPIHHLNDRLRRIAANDFSFDPVIERSNDELGQMGRVVNEMSVSINHLLNETHDMYEERKNTEIALLQSQVNPHFLYNTLDSIHWMAVIQKNDGIAGMTRSLSNLLKNIARGVNTSITLREELSLLEDYVAIQSVRYLETFVFKNEVPPELYNCKIVKLTLQPLVENAIFHGIEPTGECGEIVVTGREESGDIILCVEDDGAGIPPEQLARILTAHGGENKASLNGIGVANVHRRLQLTYGARYGLTVESELNRFTRVSVRIPKEE